jgi:hypothetical protein
MRIGIKVDESQLQLLHCLDVKLEQLAFIVEEDQWDGRLQSSLDVLRTPGSQW